MAEFWIDFSATIIMEAENAEEAREKFFKEKAYRKEPYYYPEIDCIEEIAEPPEKLLDN